MPLLKRSLFLTYLVSNGPNGWLSDFFHKPNEYWSASFELPITTHEMVIRGFRKLGRSSQKIQKFTSNKIKRWSRDHVIWYLEAEFQSHWTGFDSWLHHLRTVRVGQVAFFSGPQFPHWKRWLLIVLIINRTYLIEPLWETRKWHM